MNAQEALEILNRGYAWQYNHPEEWFTAKRLFEQLAYRATPKKPTRVYGFVKLRFVCLGCQKQVYGYDQYQEATQHFCPNCGQALDLG